MRKLLPLAIIGLFLIVACGAPKNENKEETKEEIKKEVDCKYEIVKDSTRVYWTSYKHTAKIGVKGVFDEAALTLPGNGFIGLMPAGLALSINTGSVNSKDSIRDGKIVNSLFSNISNGNLISGILVSADDKEAGQGEIELTFNDTTQNITCAFVLDGSTLDVSFSVDMNDFGAQSAMAALNKVCEAKHTGADGENKLWSTIDIVVSTHVIKTCK